LEDIAEMRTTPKEAAKIVEKRWAQLLPSKGEKRIHGGTPITCMAAADGYIMARHRGCMPFVIRLDEWNGLLTP
jgi:hypothetical protein